MRYRPNDLKPAWLNQKVFGEPLPIYLHNRFELLEQVLKLGANVNVKGDRGQTLFSQILSDCTTQYGKRTSLDHLKKLLHWGADVNVLEGNYSKKTALETLMDQPYGIHKPSLIEAVKLIIEIRGADLQNLPSIQAKLTKLSSS